MVSRTPITGKIYKTDPDQRREVLKYNNPGEAEARTRQDLFARARTFIRSGVAEGTLILILVAFFVILTFTSPTFLTVTNLSNLVRQVAIVGIVAIGMTIVIISAGIDLSVGSLVGFSSILVAVLMKNGVSILPSIVISLVAGTVLGIMNGVLIHDGRGHPSSPLWG
jgi:ribose transport system permease protein